MLHLKAAQDFPALFFSKNVSVIADSIFYGCRSLEKISGIECATKINAYAFASCSSLKGTLKFYNIKSIGDHAFMNCSGLTKISLAANVTSIADYAFYGCSGLSSMAIPEKVKTIGEYAFYSCIGLKVLTIPEGVAEVMDYAFYNCRGLTKLIIHSGVVKIGEKAFEECQKLADIYYDASVETWESIEGITEIGLKKGIKRHFDHVHTIVNDKAVTKTCEMDGLTAGRHCSSCKAVLVARRPVRALGHDYTSKVIIVQPTYTETGSKTYSCAKCGNHTDVIDMLELDIPVLHAANISKGVKLSWDRIEGAEGYYIYRDDVLIKKVTSGDVTVYTDRSMEPYVLYNYYVRAYAGENKGKKSTAADIIHVIAMQITSVSILGNGVEIKWTEGGVSNYGFSVYRSRNGGKYVRCAEICGSSYIDTEVSTEAYYSYKIVSKEEYYGYIYDSAFSDAKGVYFVSRVKNMKVTSDKDNISVEWKKNPSVTGYLLYRNENFGEYKLIKKIKDNGCTSYTDKNIKSGVYYGYRAVAYVENQYGTTKSFYVGRGIYYLASPVITKIANTAEGINIWFDTVSDGYSYEIYRSTDGGNYVKIATVKDGFYADTYVAAGKKYKYRVRTTYKTYTSIFSNAGIAIRRSYED